MKRKERREKQARNRTVITANASEEKVRLSEKEVEEMCKELEELEHYKESRRKVETT